MGGGGGKAYHVTRFQDFSELFALGARKQSSFAQDIPNKQVHEY